MLKEFLKQVLNKLFPWMIEIYEHTLAHKNSLVRENYRKDTTCNILTLLTLFFNKAG